MTLADPYQMASQDAAQQPARAAAHPAVKTRDPRLDFFRGIAMFIILVAHVPDNWLTLWIPARFGFSDATEIFVFCSGMASAIAFGSVFRNQGWIMGTARVAFRCWQVYWAHIGLFLAVTATLIVLNKAAIADRDYLSQLNLYAFFDDAMPNLVGLMTLTYVPNYFDILPMYLVILAMMPFVVACQRVHPLLALTVVVAMWCGAQSGLLSLSAEPWSARPWFFNPFGWQLVFFTGFAFMSGWLPAPPRHHLLVVLAAAVVIATVPMAYFRIIDAVPAIQDWRRMNDPLIAKTDFGILRYVHFLALAYLCWVAVGVAGRRILPPETGGVLAEIWRRGLAVIMKVGQQSLAVFITSMFTAQLLGAALDALGRNSLAHQLFVNSVGFAVLIAAAYGVGWFKTHPWKKKAART